MKRIFFYYPAKNIGGAQLLFVRAARYLSEHTDEEVFFVDYIDGFSAELLKDTKVKLIEYQKGEKIEIPEDSVAILHLGYVNQIRDFFKISNNDRFVFWSIHPSNIAAKIKLPYFGYVTSKVKRKAIGNTITNLCDKGMIRFMDYSNYAAASGAYLFDYDVDYLPIFIEDGALRKVLSFHRPQGRPLSFLWVGRLDEDKVYTPILFMNELERHASKYKLQFYIIGTGDKEELVKQRCNDYSYPIHFIGRLSGKELDDFIDDNVDVGIGMGTSMLEIAKRGKPVILKTPVSKNKVNIKFFDYVFLHEEYAYTIDTPPIPVEGMCSLENKIQQLFDNYSDIARKDYDYLCKNHLQSSVCKQLEKAVNSVRQTDMEIHNLLLEEITNEFASLPFRKYILKPLKQLRIKK